MKTVVFFIPKGRNKAGVMRSCMECPEFGKKRPAVNGYGYYLDALKVLRKSGIFYEFSGFGQNGEWWKESVKIHRSDISRAVAVLRFAGFTLIADENEIERTK